MPCEMEFTGGCIYSCSCWSEATSRDQLLPLSSGDMEKAQNRFGKIIKHCFRKQCHEVVLATFNGVRFLSADQAKEFNFFLATNDLVETWYVNQMSLKEMYIQTIKAGPVIRVMLICKCSKFHLPEELPVPFILPEADAVIKKENEEAKGKGMDAVMEELGRKLKQAHVDPEGKSTAPIFFDLSSPVEASRLSEMSNCTFESAGERQRGWQQQV